MIAFVNISSSSLWQALLHFYKKFPGEATLLAFGCIITAIVCVYIVYYVFTHQNFER
nr:hypothetical protein [uncultured Prevotella sp.]